MTRKHSPVWLALLMVGLFIRANGQSVTFRNDSAYNQTVNYYAWHKTDPCTVVSGGVTGFSPLAPHSNVTVSGFVPGWVYVWYGWNCPVGNPNGNATLVRVNTCQGFTFGFVTDTDASLGDVVFGCGSCRQLQFINSDSVPRKFLIQSNNCGVVTLTPPVIATVVLQPGQTYSNEICSSDCFTLSACRQPVNADSNTNLFTLNGIGNGCDTTVSDDDAFGALPPPKSVDNSQTNFNAPKFNGADTNITWSAATNGPSGAATDPTLRAGFSALFDVGSKGATLNHDDLTLLHQDNLRQDGELIGISNAVMSATNSGSGVDKYATNFLPGPGYAIGTNATLAQGAAALGSADTQAGTVISSLGSAPSVGSGSSSVFSIPFATGTINLDPEVIFPGVGAICRNLFGWAATLGFLFWFGTKYWDVVQSFNKTQTGGVPDLSLEAAGFGGNLVLGVAAALVVPVVLIALWVGVLTYVLGQIASVSGSSMWTSNPFGGLNSGALYLLTNYFPVSYLLSLAFTGLVLQFTMAKLAAISSATSKFLFGK